MNYIFLKTYVYFIIIAIFFNSCSVQIPDEVMVEYEKINRTVDFNYDVQPILSDRCYQCHGPDENTRKAGLRLDKEDLAFSKLASGSKAIVAGSLFQSEMAHRILASDPDIIMPTPESKLSLTNTEKAILLKWIDQGAEWKKHWAFIPPKKSKEVDQFLNAGNNPIDFFVGEKLRQQELRFSEPAAKETLLRRVSFDLTGLPPTLEALDRFLADTTATAFEKEVDRLLETEANAERLTLDWLDLSRYADSHGLHGDGARIMWPWRDWVIKAFKKNLPYDEFVTWQLAGDLLPNSTREQKLATAFNRNSPMTGEGGVIDEEWRLHYVFDRTETLSTAFMGLTVACAKCHDHKFDPISQKEYYQLTAFFNNIRELGMTGDDGNFGPLLLLPDIQNEKELREIQTRIKEEEKKLQLTQQELQTFYAYAEELPRKDILKEGLLAHYSLEKLSPQPKGKGFRVDNNKNVTTRNAPKIVEGISGNAFAFQEDHDKIYVKKEIPQFEWTDPFSVAAWINTEQQKQGFRQFIAGTTGDKNNWWRGWDFYLDDQNRINLRLINMAPGNMIHVQSEVTIPLKQWKYVAFRYDGSGKARGSQLFVDGKEVKTNILIDNLYKSILPVTWSGMKKEDRSILIGKSYSSFVGDNGTFVGRMDEIKFFNKALSPLAVQLHFEEFTAQKNRVDPTKIKDYLVVEDCRFKKANGQLNDLRKKWLETINPVMEVMVMEEMEQPRKTFLYQRGDYNSPADEVIPETPEVLPPLNPDAPKNRLGLAQWLFSDSHPLTARVAVNHYWQMLFGQGLVRTPTDFGLQGSLPSHPKLLDWLAVEFQSKGWDIKALLKMMVLSETYQQSSKLTKELQEKDPTNIYLARNHSYRLSAEMIRDNALAISGLLVDEVGGPSVKPYQPPGLWKEKNTFSLQLLEYKKTGGDSLYRRGMYTFIKRGSPPPSMVSFDATSREICTVKRENTSTPLQALVLLNDTQYFEAARFLAQRLKQEKGTTLEEQLINGFRLVTSRFPKQQELDILLNQYKRQLIHFKKHPQEAKKIIQVGDKKADSNLNFTELGALTIVANTLLNHTESYYKR